MQLPSKQYRARPLVAAFSLIELLVVIGIIAIMAAIGLPALRGLGETTAIDAAQRQMLDDLALARLRAIAERTTVYLVFLGPEVRLTNFYNRKYTAYSMFTRRGVGEQPGQENPRFLMEWRDLPDGVFFPTYKFSNLVENAVNEYDRSFPSNSFPYPTRQGIALLPCRYLAFNASGQLAQQRDEIIPLAKGSIFYSRDGRADIVETPPRNYTNSFVRVNWLTGRARVEKVELR